MPRARSPWIDSSFVLRPITYAWRYAARDSGHTEQSLRLAVHDDEGDFSAAAEKASAEIAVAQRALARSAYASCSRFDVVKSRIAD
jgi:hypothetical protein